CCLERQFNLSFSDGNLAEAAGLTDLKNVRSKLRNAVGEVGEAAGTVGENHGKFTQPAILNESFLYNPRHQVYVDVAPRQDDADVAIVDPKLFVDECG